MPKRPGTNVMGFELVMLLVVLISSFYAADARMRQDNPEMKQAELLANSLAARFENEDLARKLARQVEIIAQQTGDPEGHVIETAHRIEAGPQGKAEIGGAQAAFDAAVEAGFEGIISKRIEAPYVNARSRDWIKIKHENTDEFLIATADRSLP